MPLLKAGYWFDCILCHRRLFFAQAEIQVDDNDIPPSLRDQEVDWWAWSYLDDDNQMVHRRHCPECTEGMDSRAHGVGMSSEEYAYHNVQNEDPLCPEEDTVEIDFDFCLPTERNLAPPPRHDSSSSGVSTVMQEDYLVAAADISPEEEDDDIAHTEAVRGRHFNFPTLHENTGMSHPGAWPYYDPEYAALGPSMEPGYFYGDQHEMPWSGYFHDNIPVGYDFNEARGHEFDEDEGILRHRDGNVVC